MSCIVKGALGRMISVGSNVKFPVFQEAPALLLRIFLSADSLENPTLGPFIHLRFDGQLNCFFQKSYHSGLQSVEHRQVRGVWYVS